MKKEIKEKIDYILNHFDFEKIHKIMIYLNWNWSTKNNNLKIPSIKKMKKRLKKLIKECYMKYKENKSDYTISTGGFEVYIFKNIDNEMEFDVKFIIEEFEI